MEAQKKAIVEGIQAYSVIKVGRGVVVGFCCECWCQCYVRYENRNPCCSQDCENIMCKECYFAHNGKSCDRCYLEECGRCDHEMRRCWACVKELCEVCYEYESSTLNRWEACKECLHEYCGNCHSTRLRDGLCAKCTARTKNGSSEEGDGGSD